MADSIYAPRPDAGSSEPQAAAAAAPSADAAAQAPVSDAGDVSAESLEAPPPPPHPFLTRPLLHVRGLDAALSDKELASGVFQLFLPVRLNINRSVPEGQTASGTVEFQTLERAERALATVRGGVELSVAADPADDPKPQAKTRLVKQLAPGTEDVDVYELFRPFGPLARAVRILTNPAGVHTGFRGMALLEFYAEEDAARAQNEMHCTEVRGKTISVAIDTAPRRPSAAGGQEFSAAAAPFVPGAGASRGGGMSAAAPSFTPPQRNVSGSSSSIYATQPAPPQLNSQQAGPIIAVPGTNLQYSASAATYIDPCNLFCKNLDPEISSNDLFAAFKQFGRIVSARVMRDEHGVSREFGFVSYTTADEASRALHAMNNVVLGSKAMMVRLHEPKKMREQKLAHKFSGAPTNGVGPHGRGSPPVSGHASETNGSPAGTPSLEQGGFAASRKLPERPAHTFARAPTDSGAASGSAGSDVAQAPLSTQSVTAELARKVGALPTVRADQVDDIVKEMLKLSLPETLEALNNPVELMQRVNDARDELPQSPVAQQSAFLSTPLQPAGTLADSASVMSSAPASAKERERLLKAVHALVPAGSPVEDITDMLTSLNKKDRALCLFNADFLKTKVDEAREILDITEEDGEEVKTKSAGSSPLVPSQSPAAAIAAAASGSADAAASAQQSEAVAPAHTLVSLARLPAIEIIRLASAAPESGSAGLPLPKADPEKMRETDEFIDSLKGKPAHDQKQKVGDHLFKKIRSFGVKGAPKITITLLDSEDLRALAHLMNSYPEVLRQKVTLLSGGAAK